MKNNGTILHVAVTLGSAELVEMVLKLIDSNVLKLDVNALDASKNTALKKLADCYFRQERGPNRYTRSLGWGGTFSWTWTSDASYQCMKVMLDYRERLGIDVNKKCKLSSQSDQNCPICN